MVFYSGEKKICDGNDDAIEMIAFRHMRRTEYFFVSFRSRFNEVALSTMNYNKVNKRIQQSEETANLTKN